MAKMNWDRVKKEAQLQRNSEAEARKLEGRLKGGSSRSQRARKRMRAELKEAHAKRLVASGVLPCKYCGVLVRNHEKHIKKVHQERIPTTEDRGVVLAASVLGDCRKILEDHLQRAAKAWGDPVINGKITVDSAKRFRKNLLVSFSALAK